MRKAYGLTTSFAAAAAMLRTWSGTTYPGLPRAPSVSGFFANANSFSGGSARSALLGTLPGKCRRRVDTDEWRASASAAGGDCAKWESQDGFVVRRSFLTNSKEDKNNGEKPHHRSGGARP